MQSELYGRKSTVDLSEVERGLVAEMQQLEFGRFENLQVQSGKLLTQWPAPVRVIKFPIESTADRPQVENGFQLKRAVQDFFSFLRTIDSGVLTVQVRWGLPVSAELAPMPIPSASIANQEASKKISP